MAFSFGQFRTRFRILAPVDSADALGSSERKYQPVGECWAAEEPLGADELEAGEALEAAVSVRVYTHYRADITHRTVLERIIGGGRLEVLAAVNVEALSRFWELRCRELVT